MNYETFNNAPEKEALTLQVKTFDYLPLKTYAAINQKQLKKAINHRHHPR